MDDTYRIILQLKDELSVGLKEIKDKLEDTRVAGVNVSKGMESIGKSMKSTMAPIKEFTRGIQAILSLGGVAVLISRVVRELGNLEAAYLKVNPEMNRVIGSAAQFTAAMKQNEAALGRVVAELISPARAEFQAVLQQWGREALTVGNNLDRIGEIIGKVVRYGIKVIQTLGKIFVDQWKLFYMMMDTLVDITIAVGKIIWIPLKAGFDWMIYGIKIAFQEAINFLLGMIEGLVQGVGKGISALTGGLLGKGIAGISLGKVDFGAIKPENVNIVAEWGKVISGAIGDLTTTFNDLVDLGKTYVDVWSNTPVATMLATPETDEERKARETIEKEQAGILKTIDDRIAFFKAQNKEGWDASAIANARRTKEAEDARKLDIERNRLLRDANIVRLKAAQGFFADPIAAIGEVLGTAQTEAAGLGGGMNEMLTNFFVIAEQGLATLIGSIVEMAPVILLIIAIMKIFEGMMEIIGPSIDAIIKPFVEALMTIGNALGTMLLPIFQALEPLFTILGGALGSGLVAIFTMLIPVFKVVGAVIYGIVVTIIFVLNLIIDVINFFIPGKAWDIAKLAMPTPPKFHEGGIAKNDMLAILQKGEIVTNPYKSRSYIAGGGAGGITINAPNARYLDGRTAAELVRLGLVAMKA